MNDMMHSTGVLIALMVTLVVLLGGALIAVRLIGGKDFNRDHDPDKSARGRLG